jgi:beta-glucosidase
MGDTTFTEARAKYNEAMREDHHEMFFGLTFWTPNTNIFRFALGSRPGTNSEDPFFTARMGVVFVTRLQSNDPST